MVTFLSKTFAYGDDIAVYLPDELGFHDGMSVTVEVIGDMVKITPAGDALLPEPVISAISLPDIS